MAETKATTASHRAGRLKQLASMFRGSAASATRWTSALRGRASVGDNRTYVVMHECWNGRMSRILERCRVTDFGR